MASLRKHINDHYLQNGNRNRAGFQAGFNRTMAIYGHTSPQAMHSVVGQSHATQVHDYATVLLDDDHANHVKSWFPHQLQQ